MQSPHTRLNDVSVVLLNSAKNRKYMKQKRHRVADLNWSYTATVRSNLPISDQYHFISRRFPERNDVLTLSAYMIISKATGDELFTFTTHFGTLCTYRRRDDVTNYGYPNLTLFAIYNQPTDHSILSTGINFIFHKLLAGVQTVLSQAGRIRKYGIEVFHNSLIPKKDLVKILLIHVCKAHSNLSRVTNSGQCRAVLLEIPNCQHCTTQYSSYVNTD